MATCVAILSTAAVCLFLMFNVFGDLTNLQPEQQTVVG